jgi:NTE family protein
LGAQVRGRIVHGTSFAFKPAAGREDGRGRGIRRGAADVDLHSIRLCPARVRAHDVIVYAMRIGFAPRSIAALALALVTVPTSLAAQDARPRRVAVVLSSGGARGLAHVGVLKALEELHVPVDLVVGSEWGALIGGLYAEGFTPAEIQAALISRDWVDALGDRIPRRYLSFRSKQEDRDFLIDLPLGIGGQGLILPPGLLAGNRMRMELGRFTMRTLGTRRFDDLPIPFRVVATDLDLGESVTLEDGSLSQAIEASMSTPVLWQPVERGGRRLVSGEMTNPIPVDPALALGAEVLIVVDVVDPGTDRTQLTFFGVGQRALDLVARKSASDSRAKLRASDVLCTPELEKAELTDFERAPAVVERGRAAVMALKERLAPLSLETEAYNEHLRLRRERETRSPVLDAVRVKEGSPLGQKSIQARIENRAGERFDPHVAGTDLARLYGVKLFRRVDFDLVKTAEDHADLVVGAEPTPAAPLHWRMGLAGELTAGEDVNFVVGASVRYAPTDAWGSEWRARAELGNRILTGLEFRQALDPKGLWYIVPNASWQKHPVRVDTGTGTVSQYSVEEADLGIDLVRELGDIWEARAGIVYRSGESRLEIGDPVPDVGGSFEAGGAVFGLTCDSLDDLAFPRSGWLVRTDWFLPVSSFKEDQDETVRLRLDHAMDVGRGAIALGGELSTVVGREGSVESFFPLGGFLRLSGLHADEISGPTAVLGRAIYMHPLSRSGLERKLFTWYGGVSAEIGNIFPDIHEVTWSDLKPSGSLFLGVDTFLGPLYLGYGMTEGGNQNVFLVLGRLF